MTQEKSSFQIGATCFAKDFASSWYKSKIVELDLANNRVKVHFLGWNSRYDQWFDTENGDIKFTDESKKVELLKKPSSGEKSTPKRAPKPSEEKKEIKTQSVTELSSAKLSDESQNKYAIGQKICAKWIDENYYPAVVIRHLMKMSVLYYEVKFYDGIKKLIRFNNTRDISEEETRLYFDLPNKNQHAVSTSTVEKTAEMSQVNESVSISNESGIITEEKRRAEAELLLSIQNPQLKAETSIEVVETQPEITLSEKNLERKINKKGIIDSQQTANSAGNTETAKNDSSLRKSSRVKRLKTYKDEIVFYSSTTIAYMDEPTSQDLLNVYSKQKKRVSTSAIETPALEVRTPTEKESNNDQSIENLNRSNIKSSHIKIPDSESTKKIQKYFQLLKPTTGVKKTSANRHKTQSNQNEISDETYSPTDKKKKTKRPVSDLQRKLLKQRKEKKQQIIQKLIESSQITLKKQQELLEKQLKRHQHMKLKKKMLKMIRKQKQQQQRLNFGQNLSSDCVSAIKSSIQPIVSPLATDSVQFNLAANTSLNIQPMLSTFQKSYQNSNSLLLTSDLLPIRCNFSNCDKTFRKQSLLEYHLKYHHYVDVNLFNNFDSNMSNCELNNLKTTNKKVKSRNNSTSVDSKQEPIVDEESTLKTSRNSVLSLLETDGMEYDMQLDEEEDDPYDVVHCSCGNHKSDGFMVQCEVCLCWQHRVCLNMHLDEHVPKHHVCWICNEPGNKLKKLKYQSWMRVKTNKPVENSKNKTKNKTKSASQSANILRIDDPGQQSLRNLSLCSKKYYNLIFLMYTLEYQTSLYNKMRSSLDQEDPGNTLLNEEATVLDQIEKLCENILHLQSCAIKKFDEFRQQLDELEKNQPENENVTLPRFFNLQELYNQLQSLVVIKK